MAGRLASAASIGSTRGSGRPVIPPLLIVGGSRGMTMPLDEVINDTRLMRKFTAGSQSYDVTVGY
jgi:hypothetical protein